MTPELRVEPGLQAALPSLSPPWMRETRVTEITRSDRVVMLPYPCSRLAGGVDPAPLPFFTNPAAADRGGWEMEPKSAKQRLHEELSR